MICGHPNEKRKRRRYWREEMKAAKRAMKLYPVGSVRREIYQAKYNEAAKKYNELFEEVYNGRKVNP